MLAQLNLEWDKWRLKTRAGQEDWLGPSYAASSSLSRRRQETEAEKNAQQGDSKPLGSRKKPFQGPRREELPPEKGEMAVQDRDGGGTRFYELHFPGIALPKVTVLVRLLPRLEVIQSYCQFLQVRKAACMGIWIVEEAG